jgi:hypothetical protein
MPLTLYLTLRLFVLDASFTCLCDTELHGVLLHNPVCCCNVWFYVFVHSDAPKLTVVLKRYNVCEQDHNNHLIFVETLNGPLPSTVLCNVIV